MFILHAAASKDLIVSVTGNVHYRPHYLDLLYPNPLSAPLLDVGCNDRRMLSLIGAMRENLQIKQDLESKDNH